MRVLTLRVTTDSSIDGETARHLDEISLRITSLDSQRCIGWKHLRAGTFDNISVLLRCLLRIVLWLILRDQFLQGWQNLVRNIVVDSLPDQAIVEVGDSIAMRDDRSHAVQL